MKLNKDEIYWVEHPEHGTVRAKLAIVSSNQNSLAFELDTYVGERGPRGGMSVSNSLVLLKKGDAYVSIMTDEPWTIYENEPAEKIPTR